MQSQHKPASQPDKTPASGGKQNIKDPNAHEVLVYSATSTGQKDSESYRVSAA